MAKRRPSGDGMVRKREDGRWEGRIVVGHKKNGTPIFQHAYAHTQKELTEKLHQNIERYQDVELTEDSRMTLGEWLDRWLTDYKENTVRPGTLAGYRSCIENYIKPQLGGKQVSLVTSQDVQKLYRRLKENGRVREHPRFGSALSDTTINRLHAIFHQAMEDALHAHIIAKNPTVGATVPKASHAPKRVLTDRELDTFLDAVREDKIWGDFFYVELTTGLRRGEICGLMWQDFDARNGVLQVRRTLHNRKLGVDMLGKTKTRSGERTIVLPPQHGGNSAPPKGECDHAMDLPRPCPTGAAAVSELRLHAHESDLTQGGIAGHPLSRSAAYLRHPRHRQRRGCQDPVGDSGAYQRLLYAGYLYPHYR